MKQITDVRQLQVGMVVLMVEYDHADFSLPDPEGWSAHVAQVVTLGSPQMQRNWPCVEVVDVKELNYTLQEQTRHVIENHADGDYSLSRNCGMGGDWPCYLYVLQPRGALTDAEEDDPQHPVHQQPYGTWPYGEWYAGQALVIRWHPEELPPTA